MKHIPLISAIAACALSLSLHAGETGDIAKFETQVEKGNIYRVEVTYQGVLSTGYVNGDLAGYVLGRHDAMSTDTLLVACPRDVFDLRIDPIEEGEAKIENVQLVKMPKPERRAKPKVHHIGDSTSASSGSWAWNLERLLGTEFPALAELCDFGNQGAGGRNLRTYYQQGKLAAVLLDICPGDIVILGNNGTNGMNATFEDDVNYYLDAAEAMGARVILNSYTPHGAVSNHTKGYDPQTHSFDSYRRDAYDVIVRKVAAQRSQQDPLYLGFVEIGQNADAIFNAYVSDYKANGYDSAEAAAQAIISCFRDHNHYDQGELACLLMLKGYPACPAPGIVEQLVTLLKGERARYTLADWKNAELREGVLHLDVSEYKLDFNHPLPYADMQKTWTVKADLRCGTLGTEQVFVCKEGKAAHLIGRNSLSGDISLGYDNMLGRFFVEVNDKDENPHRLGAGPEVETGRWYSVSATAVYDPRKDESTVTLTVDGMSSAMTYPGKALRHNASLWVIGHGFPGGFPNALQVRDGDIRNLEISGEPLPRVEGQNPLFTDNFTADPAFTVIGDKVYAYVGIDLAGPGGWFNMPYWLCYSSSDMKNWTAHGPVLRAADFPYAAPGGAWAAQVVEKDGRYYYYVTLDDPKKREHTIDVAVSDSPLGPFRPARPDGSPLITDGMTPDSHRPNADIDPTVLIDDDGTPWIAWGNGDCYMARLKRNMTELDGPVRKVPMRNYSEGPWLFKRKGLYYLVYASDAPGVQPEQMAYSTAESMEGPWTYRGFISTSANHGFTIHPSVIQFKGRWYYIYHDGSYNLNGEPGGDCRRSVCAEYLHFNDDGSIRFIPLTQEGLSLSADL